MDNIKDSPEKWVPAVSLKYIWGHFFPEKAKNPNNKYGKYDDPKPLLEKYNISFVIETETTSAGNEDTPRAGDPAHFVILCREMETGGVRLFRAAIDFEHLLGIDISPDDSINRIISNGGRYVNTLHVGWPTPNGPAHVPIYIGSEQQEQIYRWIYKLKQKGFDESENRYIIFERAGGVGGDAVDQSTLSLRKIVEFLKNDVKPDDLIKPENVGFFGVDESNLKMQEVEITEHCMDPIKGLLLIPEEQHGFLSGAAVGKGKTKEWELGKMR